MTEAENNKPQNILQNIADGDTNSIQSVSASGISVTFRPEKDKRDKLETELATRRAKHNPLGGCFGVKWRRQ